MYVQIAVCSSEHLIDEEQREWFDHLTEEDFDKFVYVVDGDDSQQNEFGEGWDIDAGPHLFTAEELLESIKNGEDRGCSFALDTRTDEDQQRIEQFRALMLPGDQERRGYWGGSIVFIFEAS
jgi:hypothetical protein